MADCTCEYCVSACKNYPGWMAPIDAKLAIEAGLAKELMIDLWYAQDERGTVEVLCPAKCGYQGRSIGNIIFPSLHPGHCVFLENERCKIHRSGFKPRMCRLAMVCQELHNIPGLEKESFVDEWLTSEAKTLLAHWKELVNYEGNST